MLCFVRIPDDINKIYVLLIFERLQGKIAFGAVPKGEGKIPFCSTRSAAQACPERPRPGIPIAEIPRPDWGQPFPFGRGHWAAFGAQSFAPAQFALQGENPADNQMGVSFRHSGRKPPRVKQALARPAGRMDKPKWASAPHHDKIIHLPG